MPGSYRVTLTGTLIFIALWARVLQAADLGVTLKTDRDHYRNGDTVRIAMQVTIPNHYHLYANPLGPGIGKPLQLSIHSPGAITWVGIQKSRPAKFQPQMGEWVWAWEKRADFFFTGIVTSDIRKTCNVRIALDGLICHTACIPVTRTDSLDIPITQDRATAVRPDFPQQRYGQGVPMPMGNLVNESGGGTQEEGGLFEGLDLGEAVAASRSVPEWDYDPVENSTRFNLALALLFALLAGILLNVMPCVLPVLGIKILSFSTGHGNNALGRSLLFSAGMLTVFLALASLAVFAGYSWGQQFQNPYVLTGIIVGMVVFAMGMFDVFVLLVPPRVGALERAQKEGLFGDFLRGVFATILATPCSGPFLGATLAWTLTQKPGVVYAVFTAVGLGMALPYVLLSTNQRLLKHVPKPGPWMDDFKHIMGFVLVGFAVYLLTGLPRDMVVSAVALSVSAIAGVWVYGRFAPFGTPVSKKILVLLLSGAVIAAGAWISFGVLYAKTSDTALSRSGGQQRFWEEFRPDALVAAHMEGRNVVVNFTATWCMNCQYNKITVLHDREVVELMQAKGVLALSADLTADNHAAQSLQHHLGSRSVPFLAVFPGDTPYRPLILRDIIGKKEFLKVLRDLPDMR